MKEEQLSKISTSSAALVVGSSLDELLEDITAVCGRLVGDEEVGKPLLYISMNGRPQVIAARLATNGVPTRSITFVDTIAPPVGRAKETGGLEIWYAQNLADLTALHMAVVDMVEEHGSAASIVIDGLTTLLIYNELKLVVKFIRDVLETSRQARTVVFTTPDGGVGLLEKISSNFDVMFDLTAGQISSPVRPS